MAALTANAQNVGYLGFKAGATIVKNRLVILDSTAGQVISSAAITQVPVGVALEAASTGDTVAVQTDGVAMLTVAAAVSLGAEVSSNSSTGGKVIASSGATAVSVGIALAAAATDGDEIPVLLRISARGPANT